MDRLALPVSLRNGYLNRADSTEESIFHAVGLLLSTRIGQMDCIPDFGCDIWQMEFSDLEVANKGEVRASLRNAIDRFEPRLFNVTVSFTSRTDSASHVLGMSVKVAGNYRDDGEEKKFEASYSLG
jgi:phage baseplate assembly protein W